MSKVGVIYALIAVATWGTSFVTGKFLVSQAKADPITVAFYRFALSSVLLVAYMAAIGQAGKLRVFARQPLMLIFLGATGVYGMGLFSMLSFNYTTASNAQIIMNANPVLIVPLAMLVGERPRFLRCLGVLMGLVGCVLVTHGTTTSAPAPGHSHLIGGALALLSGLSWAAYTVWGKDPVRELGSVPCTTLAVIVGTALLGVTALAAGSDLRVSGTSTALIAYLAIAPTVLGFVAWYKALETLPASVLGPFQFLQPAIGVVLAAFILGEKLTLMILSGALLAFVGVYCTTRRAAR